VGQRIFLALRSLAYITGFTLLWLWLMPQWLNLRSSTNLPSQSPARWLGLVPLVAGAVITISCFAIFFIVGKGTPAPFDAPRHLVITGPYRYVRNPMYLGAGLVLLGCAILFAEFSGELVGYALAIIVLVNLFVFFYEEPTLRDKFGAEYLEYCKNVRRWIPRTSAWEHSQQQAVATR
jgi:protein-S-isoprenylcysteine O-methyltransferase Ste14